MSVAKVIISIESGLLKKVDYLVKEWVFSNRSQAIQSAVAEKVSRLDRNRPARECAKLDKTEEQSLADLGLASELTFELSDPSLPKKSWVKISQIRVLSTERLDKKIGKASDEELEIVIEGLNEIIGA